VNIWSRLKSQNLQAWIFAGLYLLSILLGNIAIWQLGIIKIRFLQVPAGVIFIGLTFSTRDFMQRHWSDIGTWAFMILATVITIFMNIQLAFAAGLSFFFSENVDWAVFKWFKMPFRRRIVVSNLFSVPLDSIIFITIAFGWIPAVIISQSIIKYLSGLLILLLVKK